MKKSVQGVIVALWTLAFLLGCAVTEEKISLWKGTKNGPKKLAATAIDKEVPMPLRAKAVIALTEISDRSDENVWDLFIKSFERMDKKDAAQIIELAVPVLAEKVASGKPGSVSKTQVGAKDALFALLDFATGKGRADIEAALIGWCTKDYNIRALAGKYNISAIVKKVGPTAAEALIPLLNVEEVTVKYIAELVHDMDEPKVTEKASAAYAGNLRNNIGKILEIHLVSAALIGGDEVGKALLEFAANPELSEELQRFSLRAFSESVAKKNIDTTPEHVEALFGIAENAKQDQHQREEAYYVIAQVGGKEEAARIRKLLRSKISFWRLVALRGLLRLDGEELIKTVLRDIEKGKRVSDSDEIDEIIARIAAYPVIVVKMREYVSDESTFVSGIAVGVLAEAGGRDDLALLTPLLNDERNLPKSFKHKKLSDAVKAAVEKIEERG